ncbi:SDR family NAD(P)-dependent oxidoreductase [Mucilaginibacter ginsenosidivorax]|uniref:SDR family NAD(P)-dependent oxidoreductase n=1 Tax=Mucilaginibacter ginsenosidivorax TaxID=862126 RepID=A0A5B8W448_9SPHI|nr:SDR family NAD(P)-dependent oxidoreductase [Mucilaginibacter ginsenosidivorax]QEC77666.1 SDR family NAD(P)-dependent oxidoreductase [Mucilaginibacter ginsenosidivorax]
MSKTIFITGASRGFGKIWTEAFLKRGDKVAATVRDLNSLQELVQQYGNALLPIKLDVTNRADCFAAVKKAQDHFGAIDVLINNAGFGLFGAIEETDEQNARKLVETNIFGLLWMTQAIIPVMRKQGNGHIIQLSSTLGITPVPIMGVYSSTKFAVEGLSETLAAEVKDFGIKVTLVEPNAYSTDFTTSSAIYAQPMQEYDEVKSAFQSRVTDDIFGIPESTVKAIFKLIDSPQPPLRLFLGKFGLLYAKQAYQDRLATWEEWQDVAVEAHGK